jgi:3-hydroxyisobutyrate dehydrogenase-like beta-hydroxyacid dehydrogenase
MVNQVIVLANYCILAEALTLAEAGGVDAGRIPAALGDGYAGSNMLQRVYPRLVARDFAPAGYAFQVLKDLDMVHGLAKALQVPTPMASQAATLFRTLVAKGHGERRHRRAQAVRRERASLGPPVGGSAAAMRKIIHVDMDAFSLAIRP